jgi:hypothetical protein
LDSYGSVDIAALGVGGGHKGRDEEDGGAHICCCGVLYCWYKTRLIDC